MADVSITVANVELVSGTPFSGIAGASITAGDAVYIDGTDSNKIKLADPTDAATDAAVGIAVSNATTGSTVLYAKSGAVVDIGGTVAVGGVYVCSGASAGGIAPEADLTSGDYVTILGVAITATNIKLNVFVSGVAHA